MARRDVRPILAHPLTDLMKFHSTNTFSFFLSEQVAGSISALFAKERHSLYILSSPWPYHSGNPAIAQAVNCAIMQPANPSQSSAITVNGDYSPAGNGVEADEQNELSLQKEIPETLMNPPPEGYKDHATHASGPEKISMRTEYRRYQIVLLTIGDLLVIEVPIKFLDSNTVEEHEDGKSTAELVLEMLREATYINS